MIDFRRANFPVLVIGLPLVTQLFIFYIGILKKKQRDLERVDWGGAWSDKRLVALQEVSILFSVAEAGLKGSIKDHTSFWVAGYYSHSQIIRDETCAIVTRSIAFLF